MTVQTAPVYERLAAIEERFEELERLMGLPETATQPAKLAEYGRERAEIEEVVDAYRRLKGIEAQIGEAEIMAGDTAGDRELAELAEAELAELRPARDAILGEIRTLLVPKDP